MGEIFNGIQMKSNDTNGNGAGMKSHEVFQELQDAGFNKSIMAETRLSKSQISRWAQPGDVSNPLERTGQVVDAAVGNDAVRSWLGARLGGTFIPNPAPGTSAPDLRSAGEDAELHLTDLLKLIMVVLKSKRADRADAARLRRLWERVKARVEGFIQACERGSFRCLALFWALNWSFTSGDAPVLVAA